MADLNQKVAEFKANAETCGISTERGPAMSAYVTDSLKGDGTNKYTNERVMTGKEAACMKIPGSVDEPSSAKEQWSGKLSNAFHNVADYATSLANSLKEQPQMMIKEGQKAYDNSVGSGRIERALTQAEGLSP